MRKKKKERRALRKRGVKIHPFPLPLDPHLLHSHDNWAGSVCCRENQKLCDKIPPAMSCITENENFSAVCTNPAVIETAFNQYIENEGPIFDDEPLNEYVYNMHLFMVTLLCN